MRYDVKYDHSFWMKKVDEKYKASKFEIKMKYFCDDIQMTYSRMKKIVANKTHFLTPEQDKMIEVLNIQDYEIKPCFHKKLEA